ncbi:MAG: DUF359 domain-containing protein [Candidatus Pacebacteria bacterium]|nr:DUF359 domain-containing protein [Candidatus Paceibacterota bacterium]
MQKVWGKALFGTETEIKHEYERILAKNKYKTVITVGDYCSHHLESDIKIFDKKVQRQDFDQKHGCDHTVKNPAGTIQKETWEAIKEAIKNRTNLCVDGEEDLLVIPAVLLARAKTLVVYGFPNKGICLLEANLKNKTVMRLALKRYLKSE